MAIVELPDNIERQLLTLDRQVRDAIFSRGISRLALVMAVSLGICLAVDWYLGLDGLVRLGLLAGWTLLSVATAWKELLRPLWRTSSLPELAALVERQHPELRERLTSLVELRVHDAPGASPLMRDLLTRQTVRAVDQLDLSDAAPAIRSPRMAFLAVIACMLLLAPFTIRPTEYGLLWARLFAPWGNFHWGTVELIVVDGNRIVAKGSDVPIAIQVRSSRRSAANPADEQAVVWLHSTDDVGARDSRRLEWDAEAQRYMTTLPRVSRSLTFHATTTGARSEQHRIDVSDPPAITRLSLDVNPPAYTGMPAQALDGAQGEVRAPERSRIVIMLQFNEPIATAELVWPIPSETESDAATAEVRSVKERIIPIKLADDHRSATVEALAMQSGAFSIRMKNRLGLTNDDPPRSLIVDPDLPPAISPAGTEDNVAVRPNDRHIIAAQFQDDYQLTAVELHLESSSGQQRIDAIPAKSLIDRSMMHEFSVDLADFDLKPGQILTYKMRAVDNRPVPHPQETWTKLRTVTVTTTPTAPPDNELARRDLDAREQIEELRKDVAETKEALEKLHRQTEDESLQRKDSDKTKQLDQLETQHADLVERLQKLAAELAERPLTEELAERARQLADRDLAVASQRLSQAKQGEPRDQLQPLSEAIDRLASVDKQLLSLDQQLSELSRLENDLARLEQVARNTERLAEQLEKLDQDAEKPTEPDDLREQQQQLKAEGQKLADELAELLKKHPELLDAARREQLRQLRELGEQASELVKPQEELAAAFERDGADAPASAERPANDATPRGNSPSDAAQPAGENEPANPPDRPSPQSPVDANQVAAAARAVNEQQQLANEATRQAIELARQQGSNSKATQAAAEFAGKAAEAARQAQTGNLEQAATQGQDAATSAEETASELSAASGPENEQAARAGDLAERQQKLAEQLQQMSGAPAAQRGARQQGQEQLADATAALSERLEQATSNLGSAPLNSQPAADTASKAAASADDAQQAMRQAAQSARSDDAPDAAEQAQRAVEKLQQVAREAQDLPTPSPNGQSIPAELATRVTEAARQLQQAQQQLNKEADSPSPDRDPAGQPSPEQPVPDQSGKNGPANGQPAQGDAGLGEPGSGKPDQGSSPKGKPGQGSSQPGQGSPQPGQGQPGQGQPGQGQPGQGQPGQGQPGTGKSGLAQSAEQFRKAAAAMRRIARGDGQQPADQNGENATEPGETDLAGQTVSGDPKGAHGENDLKKLDIELKKQGQRNWGRLPGQLRTEILQGASKKPRPEYARQIKSYFEEIAKPASRDSAP